MFPGQYEIDQLGKIFGILGTPSESEWPKDSSVMREAFPSRNPRGLESLFPEMETQALDLLKVINSFPSFSLHVSMYKFLSSVLTLSINFQRMLEFKPNDRISASESLWHSWFVDRD